jgi:hypothetical protein
MTADQEGALEGSEELPAIPPTQKSKFLRFRVYYSGKQASFYTTSFGHESVGWMYWVEVNSSHPFT